MSATHGVISPPTEDRRLKAVGLALLAGCTALWIWLSNNVSTQALSGPRLVQLAVWTAAGVNLSLASIHLIAAGCGQRLSWSDPRRRRALLLQVALANVLVAPILFGLLTADSSLAARLQRSGVDLPLTMATYVLAIAAWRLWRRSRQYEAVDAATAMARDPRPPVLYLRAFADDGVSVLDGEERGMAVRPLSFIQVPTPEEELASALEHLGPVVAIGKPGEPLPRLGAARLYVNHDAWQQTVAQLMDRASLVVIRVGGSPGVLWELEQSLSAVPRHRLVLAFLSGAAIAPAISTVLRPVIGAAWHTAMPQAAPAGWRGVLWRDPRRRIGSFVYFDRSGGAHAVPVSGWPPWGRDVWLSLLFRPSALPLRRAWRQIFTGLGLDARGMDARPSRGIAVVLAIAAGYAGAHWFYLGDRRRGRQYLVLNLVLLVPVLLGVADAVRFIWMDRAAFDARVARSRSAAAELLQQVS